jgi:hypothetical protein
MGLMKKTPPPGGPYEYPFGCFDQAAASAAVFFLDPR